jgi:DNA-binding response OmpR family regulator
MPTALIVEDEVEANKLLSMLVQLQGYEADSAYNGAEALAKVQSHVPDVIFLDLMLPDVDGYHVCRALKSAGTTSRIPVIIVTARLAAKNRIDSFRAGADDFVPKPYTPDQIFEALEESDAWKRQLVNPRIEGRIVLDGRDEVNTLRPLAQLRSLLVARSGLKLDGINATIDAIWASAQEWSRLCRLEHVATLDYSVTTESLTVTIRNERGSPSSSEQPAQEQISAMLAGGSFDEVIANRPPHGLTLIKRFQPG